jgi:predicted TIM-barrel fold metal-dependent hydrolase
MIIDSHMHTGTIGPFDMPPEMVLGAMDRYQIDFGLVSNIEGAEVDQDQVLLPPEMQCSQQGVNDRLLRFVRAHPGRLGALLWIKPATESCTAEFEAMVADNLDVVHGLKVHPFLSATSLDSPAVAKYIELARRHDLPVVCHSARSPESSPRKVYEVAARCPEVNFVMVHLGLGTDNLESIELVASLPNLYGDTTWVAPPKALQAIRDCGEDKILFGSDNPIAGPDTYGAPDFYLYYFREMQAELSRQAYDKLMFRNAIRLFKLDRLGSRTRRTARQPERD